MLDCKLSSVLSTNTYEAVFTVSPNNWNRPLSPRSCELQNDKGKAQLVSTFLAFNVGYVNT